LSQGFLTSATAFLPMSVEYELKYNTYAFSIRKEELNALWIQRLLIK